MGPNNPGQELLVTNDIAYISNNMEMTAGSLTWNDNQGGERNITLYIKPFSSWEVQKSFVVEIYNIQGRPDNVGDGEIGLTTGKAVLMVCLTCIMSLEGEFI